jgi:hypothetical protein
MKKQATTQLKVEIAERVHWSTAEVTTKKT